jgi:hypothetical protein
MNRRALLLVLATATVSVQAAPSAVEQARIDRLVDEVAAQAGLQFVRNGKTHSPSEAATFLRAKLKSQGADVATAEQFIERIASASSTSGQPYRIRFADGREVASAAFLGSLLTALERR